MASAKSDKKKREKKAAERVEAEAQERGIEWTKGMSGWLDENGTVRAE